MFKKQLESLLFIYTTYQKTIRLNPRFITWGLIQDLKQIEKFETLVISMEVVISVSEADLEEFPEEEISESSGQQEQSSETSHTQGTVKSLLSIDTLPTPELLERIKRGKITCLRRDTPKGGSNQAGKQSTLVHHSK